MSFWNRAIGLRRHRSDRAKQQQRKRRQSRRLLLEALESRQMMTGVPEIAVWHQQDDDYGGSAWTELYDGAGNVSFDDTAAGTPVSKRFSVENMGDAPLTLDLQSLVLPSGFSLLAPPDASVAPGNSTSFTVQFDATAAGSFSGYFSIGNDDSDENPFDIYLSALAQDDDYGGGSYTGGDSGGDAYDGDSYGGGDDGGDSYGGDSYGGDSYGGDSYGGDSYGGDSYGGDSYGGDADGDAQPQDDETTPVPDDTSDGPLVNTAPTTSGIADVTLAYAPEEMVIDLWLSFDDAEDGPELSYSVVAVSNPEIFGTGPSASSDGFLSMTASGVVGSSQVTVQGTDQEGLATHATFTVSTSLPRLSISDRKHTGETASDGFFVIDCSGTSAEELFVNYQLGGSATLGVDYTGPNAISGVLSLGQCNTSVILTISPVDDDEDEGHPGENVSLTLTAVSNANYVLEEASDTITLHDDEPGAIVWVSHVLHNADGSRTESQYGQFVLESLGQVPFVYDAEYSGYNGPVPPVGGFFWGEGNPVQSTLPNGEYEVFYELSGTAADGNSVMMTPGAVQRFPIVPEEGAGEVALRVLPGHANPQWWPYPYDGANLNPVYAPGFSGPHGDWAGCLEEGTYALGSPDSASLTIVCECSSPKIGEANEEEWYNIPTPKADLVLIAKGNDDYLTKSARAWRNEPHIMVGNVYDAIATIHNHYAANGQKPFSIMIIDHGNSGLQGVGGGHLPLLNPSGFLSFTTTNPIAQKATKDFIDAVKLDHRVNEIHLFGCDVGSDVFPQKLANETGAKVIAYTGAGPSLTHPVLSYTLPKGSKSKEFLPK